MASRIAPSTSPWETSWPRLICSYSPSSTRRARSQPSREPSSVTWLPRESATTPRRRSISARFCPYCPNSVDARRLSSKVSTAWVGAVSSGPEGASELSVGRLRNASGSGCDKAGGFCIDSRGPGERPEQAVGHGGRDRDRHQRADQGCRCHHVHRLQIWRSTDQLASLAASLFHQHVEGRPEATGVERRRLASDRGLQPREALGLHGIGDLAVHGGARRAG